MCGNVTCQKTCHSLAPRVLAASSSDKSCSSRTGMSSLATNGSVTNSVANAMPGNANITLNPNLVKLNVIKKYQSK